MKGTTLAIDSVSQATTVGKRSSTTTLAVQLSQHAGRPSRHQAARGRARDGGELRRAAAAAAAGEGRVAAVARARRAQRADRLGGIARRRACARSRRRSTCDRRPATSRTSVALPDSRWIAARRGARASGRRCSTGASSWCSSRVAWLLGRWTRSPLRFIEWLLLGLGLSTQSWFVFSLTAAWLIDHALARGLAAGERRSRAGVSTPCRWCSRRSPFVTILTLVFSGIRNGLLAQPDMHIAGPAISYGGYQLVPGSDRRRHRRPEHLLGADVGLSRAVLRVGELDGVRAGALAALGVQRVEGRRPVARESGGRTFLHCRANGDALASGGGLSRHDALPGTAASLTRRGLRGSPARPATGACARVRGPWARRRSLPAGRHEDVAHLADHAPPCGRACSAR